MPAKTETERTAEVVKKLRAMNAMVYPMVGSRNTPEGWPDRYIHHRYWRGMVEFKGPKTIVEPLQRAIIAELNARVSCSAYVARFGDLIAGRIEDADGKTLAIWDNTASGLLAVLERLTRDGIYNADHL